MALSSILQPSGGERVVDTERGNAAKSFSDVANVAALDDGNFVVVWNHDPESGVSEIHARILAPDGTAVSETLPVSTPVEVNGGLYAQYDPDVAALPDGGFVVTWTVDEYNGGYNTGRNVMGRLFEADGTPQAAPQTLIVGFDIFGNVSTSSWELQSSVASLADGTMAVGFRGEMLGGAAQDVGIALFGPDLSGPVSGHRVNAEASGAQVLPALAALADGGMVMIWQDESPVWGQDSEIVGQILDATGQPEGDAFGVNDFTLNYQSAPRIAPLANGGFAAVWMEYIDPVSEGYRTHARVRLFDADGTPRTGSIEAGPEGSAVASEGNIDIAAMPDGGFVVAYTRFIDYFFSRDDVFIQRFDANGAKSGPEQQANVEDRQGQNFPRLAVNADGDVLVGWYSSANPDRPYGLFARGFALETQNTPATGTPVVTGTPKLGEALVADTSAIADEDGLGTFAFRWLADGKAVKGATADSFTPGAAQVGKAISVEVSWTDGYGFAERLTSAASAPVALAPIKGTKGDDKLTGTVFNDTMRGLAGDDTLLGGKGADRLDGGTGNDRLDGAGGDDLLLGGGGADTLLGKVGADTLRGGLGNDLLNGGGGADRLEGGGGHDTLIGGTGLDRLDGGKGNDVLTGGKHADTFVFKKGYGRDTITDFSAKQGDRVELSSALWTGSLSVEEVIDQFATTEGGDAALRFSAKTVLIFEGITNLDTIAGNIDIL
jgi:Ca2+-binding RTX toxin-like protein